MNAVRAANTVATSLYVHVPFCVVKCGYCDFNSYAILDGDSHDRYLDALAAELAITPLPAEPITIFIGGGTPSLLSAMRLRRLFAILQRHVDLGRCREVTMEANPESLDLEKAAIALEHGVRRASIGVQTFDAKRLALLDRAHDAAGARAAFANLRKAGFANINLDLMFGIPGQTLAEWMVDLEQALQLQPDHLSCYNLTFEPGTRFRRDLERGAMARNDDSIDAEIFTATRRRLAEAGFAAYEISNFAGRGGPCLHNDHYWVQGDYVGVGPGASSHRGGVRWTNLKALDRWADLCMRGQRPTGSAETLTARQRAGEAMWLGLRRADGVDVEGIEQRVRWPARRAFAALLDRHERAGLLRVEANRVRLSEAGLLLADRVAEDFLATD